MEINLFGQQSSLTLLSVSCYVKRVEEEVKVGDFCNIQRGPVQELKERSKGKIEIPTCLILKFNPHKWDSVEQC